MYRYVGDSLGSLVTDASMATTMRTLRSITTDTQGVMYRTAVAATPVRTA